MLYVDDLADACFHVMRNQPKHQLMNVGSGKDATIAEIAQIMQVVGFAGDIEYDSSKPDGTPQKLLDVSRLKSEGWVAKTSLSEGIALTYEFFLQTYGENMVHAKR